MVSELGRLKKLDAVNGPQSSDGRAYLESAIAELKALNRAESAIKADRQKRIEAIDGLLLKAAQTNVGGKMIPFNERRQELLSFIESYSTLHRTGLLDGDAKSVKLKSGAQLGWRAEPTKLDTDDTPAKTADLIAESCAGLVKKLRAVLASIKVGRTVRLASQYLKVSVTLDKTGVKRAYAAEELSADNLAEFGIRIIEGEDKFFCKP